MLVPHSASLRSLPGWVILLQILPICTLGSGDAHLVAGAVLAEAGPQSRYHNPRL